MKRTLGQDWNPVGINMATGVDKSLHPGVFRKGFSFFWPLEYHAKSHGIFRIIVFRNAQLFAP